MGINLVTIKSINFSGRHELPETTNKNASYNTGWTDSANEWMNALLQKPSVFWKNYQTDIHIPILAMVVPEIGKLIGWSILFPYPDFCSAWIDGITPCIKQIIVCWYNKVYITNNKGPTCNVHWFHQRPSEIYSKIASGVDFNWWLAF